MIFEIVSPILGFEDIKVLELKKIDDFFVNITTNNGLSWTLVNPFVLRKYSFDIPLYAQILLDMQKDSSIEVYCMVVLQNPLEDSKVNFLAPLIFNMYNKKAIQVVFSSLDYPEFAKFQPLKEFVK
ncbi:flagellar biosynthesis protein FliW [Helicobacter sp. 16-1353]|uniref:flagellar assembly protein FliW n=1 Tax=Helicobacter sp. 16-1353 TaxID=2004996 RepID=UPI000DCAEAAC|nr:flagellar assembly protein FliW [Helicobacter sp. 16-1353]RAX55180.1 flagellar biosynthesis protein FliW [Helicobacter sp. 16-1353]